MSYLLTAAIAIAVGILISGRVIAELHKIAIEIHDRIRVVHERMAALEKAVKAKL